MGLLDGVAKGLLGKVLGGGSSQNPLMDIVLGLITNPETGCLQGSIQVGCSGIPELEEDADERAQR